MSEYRSISDINRLDHTVEETIVSDDGRSVRVEKTQDCTSIIEGIRAARDLPKGNVMRHVGSVPNLLLAQWMAEAGIRPSSPDYIKKQHEVIRKKFLSG